MLTIAAIGVAWFAAAMILIMAAGDRRESSLK